VVQQSGTALCPRNCYVGSAGTAHRADWEYADMLLTRRDLLAASGLSVCGALVGLRPGLAQQPGQVSARDRLVLLGTKGGPSLWGYVPSPAYNLLVYEGVAHVIDAGYGTTFKLIEAGLSITHHHSDHNVDLGPMLITAWANGLGTTIDVYGPAGLNALINGYWESNRFDIETRIADESRVDLRKLVAAHEYSPGVVQDTRGQGNCLGRSRSRPATGRVA